MKQNNPKKHPLSLEIIALTRTLLDKHGEDEFDEIGPDDLTDLSPLVMSFNSLDQKSKEKVSSDLKLYNRCSEVLAHILMNIEHNLLIDGKVMDKTELKSIIDLGNQILKEYFSDLYSEYYGSDSN